jgi:hypothetical protein
MPHFPVYVLVSDTTMDVRQEVHHLMEAYHNEFEVEEYETDCYCDSGKDAFDPNCEDCRGTGKYLTTWNPMSKFDWYAIWDSAHVLRNASKDPSDWEEEETFDDDIPEDEETAIAPLSSLDFERLKLPFAIVTPSGEWQEMEGDWWSEDQDSAQWKEWRKTAHDLFTTWPNVTLVVLNCHS